LFEATLSLLEREANPLMARKPVPAIRAAPAA
jgi:hypothetical protein